MQEIWLLPETCASASVLREAGLSKALYQDDFGEAVEIESAGQVLSVSRCSRISVVSTEP
jgi:hypothetical protein